MVKRYPDVDVRVFVAEPGTAHSGALLIDSQLKLRNLLREATKNGAQSVTMNQYLYRAEHIPNASCDTAEACADNNDLHGTILVDGEFAERECARRSVSVGTGDTTARHVVLDAVFVGCLERDEAHAQHARLYIYKLGCPTYLRLSDITKALERRKERPSLQFP